MDDFLGGCVVALLLVVVPLGVGLLLLRGRLLRQERRIGTLETQLDGLGRRLVALQRAVQEEAPEAAPGPAAERTVETQPPVAAWEDRLETPVPVTPAPEPSPPAEPPREAPTSPPPSPARPFEPPSPPSPPERPAIDWEQWLGIRGAAVVGGLLLIIAAFLFLRYAVEHGFFPPTVRVTLGYLAGIACVAGSETLRRRGYTTTADAVAGAGVVILYAATWAGRMLYGLIPTGVAYPVMALVTVVCGLLAWRHRTQLVAVLGLLGGFATPLLLSTGEDRPLSLFGYILLLDVGLLWLAKERRWPALGALALLGTVLYQGLWIFARMASGQIFLGLAILGLFALLFVASSVWVQRSRDLAAGEPQGDTAWRVTQVAGGLIPFAFVLYLATRADLTDELWPLALFLGLLSLVAVWMAWVQREPVLAVGAAAADLAVVLVWALRQPELAGGATLGPAWQVIATAVGLTAVFHALFELERRRRGERGTGEDADPTTEVAAAVAAVGFPLLLLVLLGNWSGDGFVVWLTGAVLLALFPWRQGAASPPGWRTVLAAAVPALGICWFYGDRSGGTPVVPYLTALVAWSVVFHGWSLWRRGRRNDTGGLSDDLAATAPSILMLAVLTLEAVDASSALAGSYTPWAFPAVALLLAFLTVLAATRIPSGALYLVTLLLTVVAQDAWTLYAPTVRAVHGEPPVPGSGGLLALLGLTVLFFTLWPLLAGRRLLSDRWAVYAAALAGPLWFFSLQRLWEGLWGDAAIGLLPVLLAVVALAAAFLTRRPGLPSESRRRTLVWFSAVALGLVALAIPLQLEKEWITLGWALQAVALLALWRRLDHPGLKWFALALAAVVTARLVANPAVLGYHPRYGTPVLNWLMYTYLVPAAALLGCTGLLSPLEVERRRPAERPLYAAGRPLGAILCAASGILVVFVWINLTVFDAFGTELSTGGVWRRMPARDLTLSLAWAVYALVLLTVGFGRRIGALRWTGLGFLMLTLCKLFLYDLGELEDLYRVASFVGLALSLLGVSLAYQRFSRLLKQETDREEGTDG